MSDILLDPTPYTDTGHDSLHKHLANAELYGLFSPYVALTSQMAALTLQSIGYSMFIQERIGLHGDPFQMPKLQTLSSTNEPHVQGVKYAKHPAANFIRTFGFDEYIQLSCVSKDPFHPSSMSVISNRPQTPAELDDMSWALQKAGKSRTFNGWFNDIYTSKRPGVVGVESILDMAYEPGTVEFFCKRIELTTWYHENGSPLNDIKILEAVTAIGSISIRQYVDQLISNGPASDFPAISR